MMAKEKFKAEVSLLSDTEVRVSRSFHAPRKLVWRAHTDPKLLTVWMHGLPGWSLPVCQMDVRPGGKYRWRWRSDEGGLEMGFFGTFSEVEEPAKLSYDQYFDPGNFGSSMPEGSSMPSDKPTIIRSSYTEKNGVTTLVTVMDFGTKEARDAAVSTGMTDGMEMGYERLDKLFAEQQGG
jgi:uncharacterized protein YndB with AHSA1/START domain